MLSKKEIFNKSNKTKLALVAILFVVLSSIANPNHSLAEQSAEEDKVKPEKSENKKFFLSHNFYYTSYTDYFDINGNLTSQRPFTQLTYKPYLLYKKDRANHFIFSPSFQHASSVTPILEDDKSDSLTYIELGWIRYFDIVINDNTKVKSGIELTAELPGIYDEEDTPTFGSNDSFAKLSFIFQDNFYPDLHPLIEYLVFDKKMDSDFQTKIFLENKIGFKAIAKDSLSSDSGLAIKNDFTLGITKDEKNEYLIQIFYTKDLDKNFNRFNTLNRYGYDLTKFQFSVVKKFDQFKLQLGLSHDIDGENTGRGEGALLSIWQEF